MHAYSHPAHQGAAAPLLQSRAPGAPLRFLFIDAESRVAHRGLDALPKLVAPDNVVVDRPGFNGNTGQVNEGLLLTRGNLGAGTFAAGWTGPRSEALLTKVMVRVDAQFERAGAVLSFVVVHSLIGGTGGGFGARLVIFFFFYVDIYPPVKPQVHQLREQYPCTFITTVSVLPFASGESPLQHYNIALAISVLQASADTILLFSNDQLLEQTKTTSSLAAGASSAPKKPLLQSVVPPRASLRPATAKAAKAPESAFAAINSAIVDALVGTLFPVAGLGRENTNRMAADTWDVTSVLTPQPQFKFAEVVCVKGPKLATSVRVDPLELAEKVAKCNAQFPCRTLTSVFFSTCISRL
jgi:hypothetical protein